MHRLIFSRVSERAYYVSYRKRNDKRVYGRDYLAWFRLRQTQAQTPRPYRAFGGHVTATVSLLLSVVIFYACFSGDISTLLAVGAVFALVLAWHTLKRKSYLPTTG